MEEHQSSWPGLDLISQYVDIFEPHVLHSAPDFVRGQ